MTEAEYRKRVGSSCPPMMQVGSLSKIMDTAAELAKEAGAVFETEKMTELPELVVSQEYPYYLVAGDEHGCRYLRQEERKEVARRCRDLKKAADYIRARCSIGNYLSSREAEELLNILEGRS